MKHFIAYIIFILNSEKAKLLKSLKTLLLTIFEFLYDILESYGNIHI